ncbi:uncharacterized protein LOC122015883 [Zingiber officinale]|uniref:50S ribosomal protein L34 n=1 Tax=Zingiber officinale TaxID=94328 RepID=A0A8J5KG87_ZINOF|nr:uncharacterized protein LOC122015883 [Zingiber officinale]KAG6482701.1 hypothetical protein ZIOFF_059338 [Zingiber officinale]
MSLQWVNISACLCSQKLLPPPSLRPHRLRSLRPSSFNSERSGRRRIGPRCAMAMEGAAAAAVDQAEVSMKLLFVEMGVGYDQHGQDITAAAMRACRDAISSNSIPAFRRGSIPGVNSDQMKLVIRLGVPRSTQNSLDIERIKSIFPYGEIIKVEVVDGGMICSSGVCLEAMGDKNEDCYIVNAAVYVGY